MTALEVIIWWLIGSGLLVIAIALFGCMLLGLEVALALYRRFKG